MRHNRILFISFRSGSYNFTDSVVYPNLYLYVKDNPSRVRKFLDSTPLEASGVLPTSGWRPNTIPEHYPIDKPCSTQAVYCRLPDSCKLSHIQQMATWWRHSRNIESFLWFDNIGNIGTQ